MLGVGRWWGKGVFRRGHAYPPPPPLGETSGIFREGHAFLHPGDPKWCSSRDTPTHPKRRGDWWSLFTVFSPHPLEQEPRGGVHCSVRGTYSHLESVLYSFRRRLPTSQKPAAAKPAALGGHPLHMYCFLFCRLVLVQICLKKICLPTQKDMWVICEWNQLVVDTKYVRPKFYKLKNSF